MASWQQKTINRTQTLADKLQAARFNRELCLANVSKKLSIPLKYLELLEAGQYQALPGDVYVRAWLKKYADYLGLAGDELLVDFKIENNISKKIVSSQPPIKKSKVSLTWLKPRLLRWAGIMLVVVALLAYLSWEVVNIITPPQLLISEPVNNLKTTAASLDIVGQTQAESQLTINGETVLLDAQGNFRRSVNLTVGLNNLEISAKKKHSQTRHLQLVILREGTNN